MMRTSSIDRLPKEIRASINSLRVDRGYTIAQICEYLGRMDISISKSAMGRHVQKIEEVTEKIRTSRAIAEGVASSLNGKDEGQLMALTTELLQAGVLRILSATDENGEDVVLAAKDAMALGRALESASKASKITADRIIRIRMEAAKETAEKAAGEVETALKTKAPGLSAETVQAIKQQVLGVVDA